MRGGDLADVMNDLREKDWRFTPVLPYNTQHPGAGKAPGAISGGSWVARKNWNSLVEGVPSWMVDEWATYPECNIGLVIDPRWIAIDIDDTRPEVLAAVKDVLGEGSIAKVGFKGETILYRVIEPIPTTKFQKVKLNANGEPEIEPRTGAPKMINAVELLGVGAQTVVPPSIHVDTGAEYEWTRPETPLTCSPEEMDETFVAAASVVEALTEALQKFDIAIPVRRSYTKGDRGIRGPDMRQPAEEPRKAPDEAREQGDKSFIRGGTPSNAAPEVDEDARDLNEWALANLASWVEDLNLYKGHFRRDGVYRAVPTWRDSSSKPKLEDRDPNLSISPHGIVDFGTDERFTPVDLICTARGCDVAEAFSWLRALSHRKDSPSEWAAFMRSINEMEMLDENGDIVRPGRRFHETADQYRDRIALESYTSIPAPQPGNVFQLPAPEMMSRPAAPGALIASSPAVVEEIAAAGVSAAVIPAYVPEERSERDLMGDKLYSGAGPFPLGDLLNLASGTLIGDLVSLFDAETRGARFTSGLLASAIMSVATVMGRRADINGLRTNLYTVIVAGSGTGKTSVLDCAIRVLDEAQCGHLLGASDFSSGNAIHTALKQQPSFLSVIDEFGSFLASATNVTGRSGSHQEKISTELRKAWSSASGIMTTMGKAAEGSERIYQPCVSILGAATDDQFWDALGAASLVDGLFARFLVVPAEGLSAAREGEAPEVDPVWRRAIIDRLHALAHMIPEDDMPTSPTALANFGEDSSFPPKVVEFRLDDEAGEEINAVRGRARRFADIATSAGDEGAASVFHRVAEMTLRIALVRAGARNARRIMQLDDIRFGAIFAEWVARRVISEARTRGGATIYDQVGRKIERHIEEAGPKGISVRDLRKLMRATLEPQRSDAIRDIADLTDAEVVKVRTPGGGRARIMIRARKFMGVAMPEFRGGSVSTRNPFPASAPRRAGKGRRQPSFLVRRGCAFRPPKRGANPRAPARPPRLRRGFVFLDKPIWTTIGTVGVIWTQSTYFSNIQI